MSKTAIGIVTKNRWDMNSGLHYILELLSGDLSYDKRAKAKTLVKQMISLGIGPKIYWKCQFCNKSLEYYPSNNFQKALEHYPSNAFQSDKWVILKCSACGAMFNTRQNSNVWLCPETVKRPDEVVERLLQEKEQN